MGNGVLEDFTIEEKVMSRINSKHSSIKRTDNGDFLSYIFGRDSFSISTDEEINLISDFLINQDMSLKKLDLIMVQYGIKNNSEIVRMMTNILESNGFVISKNGEATKIINLGNIQSVEGLDSSFLKKINEIKRGGRVSNSELMGYLEQIRLVLIAKASGKIEKRKTRTTYSAITDRYGIVRKKEALTIVEEVENHLPSEATLSHIEHVSTMILDLELEVSKSFMSEEELDEIYRKSRERAMEQKRRVLEDSERFTK